MYWCLLCSWCSLCINSFAHCNSFAHSLSRVNVATSTRRSTKHRACHSPPGSHGVRGTGWNLNSHLSNAKSLAFLLFHQHGLTCLTGLVKWWTLAYEPGDHHSIPCQAHAWIMGGSIPSAGSAGGR